MHRFSSQLLMVAHGYYSEQLTAAQGFCSQAPHGRTQALMTTTCTASKHQLPHLLAVPPLKHCNQLPAILQVQAPGHVSTVLLQDRLQLLLQLIRSFA